MTSTPEQDRANHVVDLTTEFALEFDDVGWSWAGSQWHELVACMLAAVAEERNLPIDPLVCADALAVLNLVDVALLSDEGPGADSVPAVLVAAGFPPTDASELAADLQRAAHHLAVEYDGQLQRLVRFHGERLLTALAADLGLTSPLADVALRRWMQSTMNMPVQQRGRVVEEARASIGVSADEVVAICEAEDLNLAAVDEAMRLDAMAMATALDMAG